MRRATENQGNGRTLAENYSPRAKVKDFSIQPCSPAQCTSFVQETPMKPSQVPNRLPHAPPRRMLPLHKPELCPVSPRLEQQHHRTPSSEKLVPALDSNSSSLKRRRDSEDCDNSAMKLHRQSENSYKAKTPKTADDSSLRPSATPVPSQRESAVLDKSPKPTDSLKPPLSPHPVSPSFGPHRPRPASKGAKQACITNTSSHTLKITDFKSPQKQGAETLRKVKEVDRETEKSGSSVSPCVSHKDNRTSSSPHSGSHHRSPSVLTGKTPDRGQQVEENRKSCSFTPKSAIKPNSLSRSSSRKSKTRRTVAVADIDDLFTPDPLTYTISRNSKTPKPKTEAGVVKSPTSETASSTSTVTGSSCSSTQNVKSTSPRAADTKVSPAPPQDPVNTQLSTLTVTLKRINPENLKLSRRKSTELKNSHISSLTRQLKECSVKSKDRHTSNHLNNVKTSTLETEPAASEHSSTNTQQLQRQASRERGQPVNVVDPVDEDLDLDLSLALDMDLTQSSNSSEDEQLLSLQEMMERATRPPDTPEKGAFSEPGTPRPRSCKPKTQPVQSCTKSGNYKNSLDQMLKEINTNKRSKEIETQLLTACKEDLLRIAEYEEAEENREEEPISSEHQEFLQRYSLVSSAIREIPPGEVVFDMEKFGQIFNHDTLHLRKCMVIPQGAAQKTLLWSSPAQLRHHVNSGLFQEAYTCHSPCPTQVTRFLFKMMSVHHERIVSENILLALCDIASSAAYQIVKTGSQEFEVWVPSLADVALVLMNLGASFVTLFPFENLQPPFTEGDLLEDVHIKAECLSSKKEVSVFPEQNCINILKYLSYCLGLCPRAYSDYELLLLLTVVGKVGMDTQLMLQSASELYSLLYKIVNNFSLRDWSTMLPRICSTLTDLTDDHHNMCLLVSMLPDSTRGKQLRRHLSLSMISKLLDGNCNYRPTEEDIQLSELRPFLPRMQPSSLLRIMLKTHRDKDDIATLDQQSYYLCYSLLTLTNEASNFQFFPVHQKEHLLGLCSELEMHVKCDIRESEKCLYRSKVKDLVARIYTKWQILLQKTKPLNGKVYDFWQPSAEDTLTSIQEEQEVNTDEEREGDEEEDNSGAEENEEENSGAKDNEVEMITDEENEEVEEDTVEEPNKTEDKMEKEVTQPEAQVHSESIVRTEDDEAANNKITDVQTESGVMTRGSPLHNEEEAGDLVS